ncbi:hypothetical protein [Sporosarcina pasteurii]|uniref:YhjD n=1 Tax=Sporosarcina pasteurii TaxID=1474 RepID=A0A380BFQ3_SPOPA|nr:hypothetical protein [Sporosarcina pasteurii]MDS9470300.1 hypothetical protein [Sporosarcina pasteurii]QBQ05986.1 hypothetical protein E2C16_10035 [Sporosarcina pasteurii]SUI99743.1 Uncharacterised protein [Sporosarcina pasteurii]
MALIPPEALPHVERMIYLPMVLIILEKDRKIVEDGKFKLKRPYIQLLDEVIKTAQAELQETMIYLQRHHIKVSRGKTDDTFTEYVFLYGGYEEQRRYLNVRLRNKTEELLTSYFCATKKFKRTAD